MKTINAFYLGAHLPVSLFFFFHLAYCRTLSSAKAKRRKITNTLQSTSNDQPLQVGTVPNSDDGKSIVPSGQSSSGGEGESSQDPLLGDEEEAPLTRRPQGDRPSIRHPTTLFYWLMSKLAESGNLDISSKSYKKFRWSLVLIHAMFGVTIVLVPMAPPRMMPDEGYVDTIIMYTRTELTKTEERLGVNPYAAMPSLHFSYALFVGMGYFFFASHRWLRITGFVYVQVVGAIIVITGNHYILDAVVALAYCALCVYISSKIVAFMAKRRANNKGVVKTEDNFEKIYSTLHSSTATGTEQALPAKDNGEDEAGSTPKQRGSPRILLDV